jgi:hypothetical protein
MGTNYNPITNIIYKGKGYGKLYNTAKNTVTGAYNWTTNTTWGQKGTDLKNAATNPHTYEAITALVITHKLGKLTGPIVDPELPAVPKAEVPVEKVELKPYEGPGGGHHVPAKSAFIGDATYDANKALAIPNEELERLNIIHSTITTAQRAAYRAFAATKAALTWDVVAKIEANALESAGMESSLAQRTVNKAINALKKAGIANPTRIPWGGK